MSKITIIANIIVKADKIDLVEAEMLNILQINRSEAGCINCDLHQDNENPVRFMFYENWETHELWQKHIDSQHLKHFIAVAQEWIEGFTIHEMTKVS